MLVLNPGLDDLATITLPSLCFYFPFLIFFFQEFPDFLQLHRKLILIKFPESQLWIQCMKKNKNKKKP